MPIHPKNYAAMGLKWIFEGDLVPTYFIDTRLPFGGQRAPGIFHRLTQSVCHMMLRRGFLGIVVYLDDFLIVGRTPEECQQAFDTLFQLLLDLGFQVSPTKLVPACQQLTFLSVQINTVTLELSLPQKKLEEMKEVIASFVNRKRATKRQLQQLAGKLNWACRVVYGGRTFLHRILNCMNAMLSNRAKYYLTPEFCKDVFWWHNFLQVFNGKRLLLNKLPIVNTKTDACQLAVGAYFRGDWVYSFLPADAPPLAPLHINYKEAFAICLAARCRAPQWANHRVIIECDNQPAVAMINKGSTKNPVVMAWLWDLFWLSAVYNFRIQAVYVPGKYNILADSISRLHEYVALVHFYNILCSSFPAVWVNGMPLTQHMSLTSCLFLHSRYASRQIGWGAESGGMLLSQPGIRCFYQEHL